MEDVKSIVFEVVSQTGKVDLSAVNGETRLAEDLKLKSVDKISLSAILSSKLSVTVSMFDILKIKNVSELVSMVEAKLKK